MTIRRRRPEDRAADHQIAAVRDELHDIIDRVIDDWRSIDHLAAMALANHGDGDKVQTSSISDPTGHSVSTAGSDPANQWLEDFRRLRVAARLLDGKRADLARVTHPERGRTNTVDICTRCGQPNPKMHRVDGDPYCATTCYFQLYRERQRANAANG